MSFRAMAGSVSTHTGVQTMKALCATKIFGILCAPITVLDFAERVIGSNVRMM